MTLTKKQRQGHEAMLAALRQLHNGRLDPDAARLERYLLGALADDDAKRAEREAARKAKRQATGGAWVGDSGDGVE